MPLMTHERVLSRRQALGLLAVAAAWPAVAARAAPGRRFFVSPDGHDGNDGSEQAPFATIGAVFRQVPDLGAGDSIIVGPGVYEEAVVVSAGGDPSGHLTLVSREPRAAVIRAPAAAYSAINIVRSHVTVEGFDVQSTGTGHAIEATFLDGDNRKDGPHHIIIRNNHCHDSAGSGISVSYGDYYLIENNLCLRNCASNPHQGSGISVYAARAVEGPGTDRIIVRGNVCHDNMAIRLPGDVPHSDGNGIIIDDMMNSQSGHSAGSYPHRTIVENNVCHHNGGKGIHVYRSENVVVCNNTCCYNGRDPKNPGTWRGELSNVDSDNCSWINNIGVADPAANAANAGILEASSRGRPNSKVVWMRNLAYGGRPGARPVTQQPPNPSLTAGAPYRNLLGVPPRFVRGGPDEAEPDFRLQTGSPAIGAAAEVPLEDGADLDGTARRRTRARNLGAFQSGGT